MISQGELDDLAARLADAITTTLKVHLKPVEGVSTAQEIICRTADMVALIAHSGGAPTRPFRHLGKRLTGADLQRIVQAQGRQDKLSVALTKLNGNAIDALADAGWTRSQLAAFPKQSAAAARGVLARLDRMNSFIPPDLKPARLKEIGIAKLLLNLLQRLTGQRGSTNEAGIYIAMLESVEVELPIYFGNLQSLARAAIRGRNKRSEG